MRRLKMTRLQRGGLIVLAAIIALVAGVALATPPSGFVTTLLARSKLGQLHIHDRDDGITIKSKGDVDHVVLEVTIEPGGSSGWHHHPGPGLASIVTGALTVYDKHCNKTVYEAGEGFEDSHHGPILVRNETDAETLSYVTYIVPTETPAEGLRIDDPQPKGCDVE
jgi:quercetin dioxygenase-like cupin family protein